MRRSAKLLGAVGVACIAAAGGSAFTASNTVVQNQLLLGTSTTTVSGGVINTIKYNINNTGLNVDTVTLVLDTDTHDSSVDIGFTTNPNAVVGTLSTCTGGTFASGVTTYTCPASGTFTLDPTAVIATHVVVH